MAESLKPRELFPKEWGERLNEKSVSVLTSNHTLTIGEDLQKLIGSYARCCPLKINCS